MEDIMDSDDDKDDNDSQGEKFFAGGGAPGGGHTQILGNNDKKIDAKGVFDKAKQ